MPSTSTAWFAISCDLMRFPGQAGQRNVLCDPEQVSLRVFNSLFFLLFSSIRAQERFLRYILDVLLFVKEASQESSSKSTASTQQTLSRSSRVPSNARMSLYCSLRE